MDDQSRTLNQAKMGAWKTDSHGQIPWRRWRYGGERQISEGSAHGRDVDAVDGAGRGLGRRWLAMEDRCRFEREHGLDRPTTTPKAEEARIEALSGEVEALKASSSLED